MKGIVRLLILCAVMVCLACERRPLYDPDDATMLNVRLVTDGIHNVTCDIYNPNVEVPAITSEMLRVLIYDKSGTPILSQGFISNKRIDDNGFEVFSRPLALSSGEYKLLSYNFDLDATDIQRENDYNTIMATTTEISQHLYKRFGSRSNELGKIVHTPDHLMVARAPELTVQTHSDTKQIDLDAHTIVETYYVQIHITGAANIANDASCQAVISGMVPSNYFGQDIRDCESPASLYFEMTRNIDPNIPAGENQDVLCAVFNTFGKIPDGDSEMCITLSVLTRDGKTHQKIVDMAPVFATEDARLRHWLLIDDVWDIPEPVVSGGGGFAPDIEDWGDIEETIPIGPRN